VCPADTYDYLKELVDLVTFAKGGAGVLREVGDLVLTSKGLFEKILNPENPNPKI
jgi:3-deoxy-D-manno-octulosonate 8-phosphate phosphatase KdsC-like HAD superfamily phosphatase